MKKRWSKYLLASLALVSTAAIVTPIIVSCSDDSSNNTNTSGSGGSSGGGSGGAGNTVPANVPKYEVEGYGKFIDNNLISQNNPVPDLCKNSTKFSFPKNDLTSDLPKIESVLHEQNDYANSDISDQLQFNNTKFDVKTLSTKLSANYEITNFCSFIKRGSFILSELKNNVFNNFVKGTNINSSMIEFTLPNNLDPKKPEVIVTIHLMNNKTTKATFYGFNDASIDTGTHAQDLLEKISSRLHTYLNNMSEVIDKKNQNKPFDNINDFEKSANKLYYFLKTVQLNKLYNDATSSDYSNALLDFWNKKDLFPEVIKLVQLSNLDFLFSNNNNYFITYFYDSNANKTESIIVSNNFLEKLTINDFDFTSDVNKIPPSPGTNPNPYRVLKLKFKNYNTSYVQTEILVADASYQQYSEQQFLDEVNNKIQSLLPPKQGYFHINLSLNQDLFNYGWYIKSLLFTNILLDESELPANIFCLKDIFKEVFLDLNSKNITLKFNPNFDQIKLSLDPTNPTLNLLVIKINDTTINTKIQLFYNVYKADLLTDFKDFVNDLDTNLFNNKTIQLTKNNFSNINSYGSLSLFLERELFNSISSSPNPSSRSPLKSEFIKMVIKKYNLNFKYMMDNKVYYFKNDSSYKFYFKKIIEEKNLIFNIFNQSFPIFCVGYDSVKQKMYIALCNNEYLPYSDQIIYLNNLKVSVI